jgi:transcriptional regulator with XRE-family HTH domain
MNPVNDRIKKIRSVLKLTQVNFSKKIFISQGSYNDIETGTRKVNERIIQLICSQFNINKDWLKTGKGEMFYKEKPDISLEHLIEIYKQLDNPLKEYLLEQSELLLKLNNKNKIKKK